MILPKYQAEISGNPLAVICNEDDSLRFGLGTPSLYRIDRMKSSELPFGQKSQVTLYGHGVRVVVSQSL